MSDRNSWFKMLHFLFCPNEKKIQILNCFLDDFEVKPTWPDFFRLLECPPFTSLTVEIGSPTMRGRMPKGKKKMFHLKLHFVKSFFLFWSLHQDISWIVAYNVKTFFLSSWNTKKTALFFLDCTSVNLSCFFSIFM